MRGLVYTRERLLEPTLCARFSPRLHRSRAFARPNSPRPRTALYDYAIMSFFGSPMTAFHRKKEENNIAYRVFLRELLEMHRYLMLLKLNCQILLSRFESTFDREGADII